MSRAHRDLASAHLRLDVEAMLGGGYLQVDETPVRVLDPDVQGKAARGYLWFYAVPGRDVILEFDRSRGMAPVRKRLQDFVGTIQTDAYEVYQSLERKESHIERIACLAHARRYFLKAAKESLPAAVWFITQIRSLLPDRGRDPGPAGAGTLSPPSGKGASDLGGNEGHCRPLEVAGTAQEHPPQGS